MRNKNIGLSNSPAHWQNGEHTLSVYGPYERDKYALGTCADRTARGTQCNKLGRYAVWWDNDRSGLVYVCMTHLRMRVDAAFPYIIEYRQP